MKRESGINVRAGSICPDQKKKNNKLDHRIPMEFEQESLNRHRVGGIGKC